MKRSNLASRLLSTAMVVTPAPPKNNDQPHGDAPYLLERGWTPLIQGASLRGWKLEQPAKGNWASTPAVYWDGEAVPKELTAMPCRGDRLVNGAKGRVSNIVTTKRFGDVELYLEFLLPAQSNSGVDLHGLYEVQVFDSFGVQHPKYSDCGGIYERVVNGKGVGGTPPSRNAARQPGEWQSFHIWFRGPRFDAAGKKVESARFLRVLHNGILAQENVASLGLKLEATISPSRRWGHFHDRS